MGILEAIASALQVLAYFFNPKLRAQRENEKVVAIFKDLEHKLEKALLDKDMYTVDKVRHWLQEMRDKYTYLKENK